MHRTPGRKGTYPSSFEESYIGLRTPPSSELASELSGSSSGSSSARWSRTRSTFQGEICIEPRRVGHPSLTRRPAYTCPIHFSHPYVKPWNDGLAREVYFHVESSQVKDAQVDLCHRQWRGYLWEGSHVDLDSPVVLLVRARLDQDLEQRWVPLCGQLRSLLDGRDWNDVGIEIADPRVDDEIMTYPVLPDDEIVAVWPNLEQSITNLLRYTDCLQLDVVRRGTASRPKDNPITLAITIPETSSMSWDPVCEQVVEILDTAQLKGVAVEVGRGALWPAASHNFDVSLPSSIWDLPARVGASMGIEGKTDVTATFGGFVEIRRSNQEWDLYGLICHHAVVPKKPDGLEVDYATLHQWNVAGIKPGHPSQGQLLRVSQPSQKDYQTSVERWNREIRSRCENPRFIELQGKIDSNDLIIPPDRRWFQHQTELIELFQGSVEKARSFFKSNSNQLGHVWATSGLRQSAKGRSLDWALIVVLRQRQSTNSMPRKEEFPEAAREYWTASEEIVSSIAEPDSTIAVYKVGRTTGATSGCINGIRSTRFEVPSAHKVGQWRKIEALDYTISCRQGKEFSRPGDSGGLILDGTGAMVGLLLGGNSLTNVTHFSAVGELFADIKAATGAIDVRLPPSA